MNKILKVTLLVTFSGFMLTACTQMPTEKQGISDMRPQISIKADDKFFGARLQIDGLDMGAIGDYLDGTNSLRILSGSHQILVIMNGQVLLNEKFYLGDGVNRTFLVK